MDRPLDDGSPFHAGEQALQRAAGLRDRMEMIGRRSIRDHMPDQHRELFEKLPFLLVGSLDAAGQPWASLLAGRPGFAATPDARTLVLGARPLPGDPLAAHLAPGAPLGLLGIELATRRRNRMNGRVTGLAGGTITVRVDQSFGNCPQYIQRREPRAPATVAAEPGPAVAEGPGLSARARAIVAAADTFFIASASPDARAGGRAAAGADVSHRGGPPGFVLVEEVEGATVLTVPDYRGNAHFNTLGNLLLEPRAGLLFVDFADGTVLQLSAVGELLVAAPEHADAVPAERLLRLRVTGGVRLERALPFRWGPPELAPQLA